MKWLINRLPNVINVTTVNKFSHMGFAISPFVKPINELMAKQLKEDID